MKRGYGIVTNPNAYFEPEDGTLVFKNDGTVWDDMRILPSEFSRPGQTDPTIQTWTVDKIGYSIWCFNPDQLGYFSVQVPHSYKEGSDIYVHAHWTPKENGATEDGHTVAWGVWLTWANIDAIFDTSVNVDLTDTCDGVNDKHLMTPDILIDGTGKTVSSMITGLFYRDTGDSWSGTGADGPGLLELDFHFEIDTIGSRERLSK